MGIPGPVWQSLDSSAGGLAHRTRRRIGWIAAGVASAVLLAAFLGYSGAVVPAVVAEQYGWHSSFRSSIRSQAPARGQLVATKSIFTLLRLTNKGWSTADVAGVGADIPGMRFEFAADHGSGVNLWWRPSNATPLEPDEHLELTLHYTVTDCAAVPSTPQDIPVRLARFWGEQTIHVRIAPLRAESGGWSVTTRDDPHHIEWQRLLADDVCGTRGESSR